MRKMKLSQKYLTLLQCGKKSLERYSLENLTEKQVIDSLEYLKKKKPIHGQFSDSYTLDLN